MTTHPQPVPHPGFRLAGLGLATLALAFTTVTAAAQGILTLTPGSTIATSAGNGTASYSGDNAAATAATLASPSAVAYDAAGDLFIADANNHVIREIATSGTITTVAGNGTEGFSGDNGPATAAQLDTPTGIAIDRNGNLYIADSHNHRIREVSTTGTITTIAGTGVPGFSGDNAAATAAQLALPSAVAVDANLNLYIADTNNHRIRKITAGNITTVAGNGEETYIADGVAATSAPLDSPTGVAVDAAGNIYIADRLNQRIREVTASTGLIATIAGTGSGFSGSFSGDGATATAATLARPSGVSVDAAGNIYVADTGNQRIRQIGNGSIATIAGTGSQGFGGDNGPATAALLNAPRSVAAGANGNLSIADRQNQRIRAELLPTLTFPTTYVGVPSATQSIVLTNTGTASITVSTINIASGFTTANGGTCSAVPITLATGASCTQYIESLPTTVGTSSGSVAFSGTGIVPESILLTGTALPASTTTTLLANPDPSLAGQPVTLTATVTPQGIGTPTGTISILDNGTTLLSAQLAANGIYAPVTSALPAGTNVLTASYAGDPNFTHSASTSFTQQVEDFTIALTPQPGNPSGTTNQTVIPGHAVSFLFALTPVSGPFNFPIALTATGLPPGATAVFAPSTVTTGANAATSTLTIQTVLASLHHDTPFGPGRGSIVLALLLLPFSGRLRRRTRKLRPLTLALALLLSIGALGSLTGCGTDTGYFGQAQKDYTITVTGTATGSGGYTLQHTTTVVLTLQ